MHRRVYSTIVVLGISSAIAAASELRTPGASDCSFIAQKDEFLARESRVRRDVMDRIARLDQARTKQQGMTARAAVAAEPVPRRNFIDVEIFGKLDQERVQPAPLASDAKFYRRVSLDLTGRFPAPERIRALARTSP